MCLGYLHYMRYTDPLFVLRLFTLYEVLLIPFLCLGYLHYMRYC